MLSRVSSLFTKEAKGELAYLPKCSALKWNIADFQPAMGSSLGSVCPHIHLHCHLSVSRLKNSAE